MKKGVSKAFWRQAAKVVQAAAPEANEAKALAIRARMFPQQQAALDDPAHRARSSR